MAREDLIQVRRGTTAQWAADPVLAAGEPGYDRTSGKFAIGDGTTVWSGLHDLIDTEGVTVLSYAVDLAGDDWTNLPAPGTGPGIPREFLPTGVTAAVIEGDSLGVWALHGEDPAVKLHDFTPGRLVVSVIGGAAVPVNMDGDLSTVEALALLASDNQLQDLQNQITTAAGNANTALTNANNAATTANNAQTGVTSLGVRVTDLENAPPAGAIRRSVGAVDPVALLDTGDAPIAVEATAEWDSDGIREPDGPVYDPATDEWVCVVSGRSYTFEVLSSVGMYRATAPEPVDPPDPDADAAARRAFLAGRDLVWVADPANPIVFPGEDPFLARAADGTLWRDSSGRAHLYAEEKDYATHRGVVRSLSGPGDLTFAQTPVRVLDKNPDPDAWDGTDRTSPTVFVGDDGDLHMLYEGRRLIAPEQYGSVGHATSSDEGDTWTADPEPLVAQGLEGSWTERAVVPDHVVRAGGSWVLFTHGEDAGGNAPCGRFATSLPPSLWEPGCFAELPGNPWAGPNSLYGDVIDSQTVSGFGSDLELVAYDAFGSLRTATIRSAPVEP